MAHRAWLSDSAHHCSCAPVNGCRPARGALLLELDSQPFELGFVSPSSGRRQTPMKGRERLGRSRPAVLAAALLVLATAWIWLIRGGASPSTASASALQALCDGLAAGGGGGSASAAAGSSTFAGDDGGDERPSSKAASLVADTGSTSDGGATDSGNGGSRGKKHVYVVGCGHSGTSLLKRTVGNLPGLLCMPKETWLYEQLANKHIDVKGLRWRLRKWDTRAAKANFTGWVEKTPRHVNLLADIFRIDTAAQVVLIVRDGRDVASSILHRGFPWKDVMTRWVKDNSAALPFLGDPRLLVVKFEEFTDATRVLGVLRQLAAFLRLPAPTERLLLALQPPTALLTNDEQCVPYASEADKVADLAASYMLQMAVAGGMSAADAAAAANLTAKDRPPDKHNHQELRSWQSSQAWAPQRPKWRETLSEQQQADIAANADMQRLLARFGYVDAEE